VVVTSSFHNKQKISKEKKKEKKRKKKKCASIQFTYALESPNRWKKGIKVRETKNN